MTKKHRVVAAAMCVALMLVMVFSALYIIVEADHNCTGDGCRICHEIQLCRQTLSTLGTAAVVAAVCRGAVIVVEITEHAYLHAAEATTLISLKVKLSD